MRFSTLQSRTPRLSRALLSFVILGVSVVIAGCAGTKLPASVAGGECRVFERPEYAVRGKRPYDQDWIDSTVEGGVGGCGWARPKARPASLDAVRAAPKVASAPVKKPSIVQRVKARIAHPFTKPVPAVVDSPPVLTVPEPAPAPPPPRDPVDELLHPSEPVRRVY